MSIIRYAISVLVISACLTNPVAAQQNAPAAQPGSSPPESTSAPAGTGQPQFLTTTPRGVWQAASLIGEEVYAQGGQKAGTIKDLLIGPGGLLLALVIDLQGSQKTVAVPAPALQFLGKGSPSAPDGPASQAAQSVLPKQLTLELSLQQLKNAPEFKPSNSKQ